MKSGCDNLDPGRDNLLHGHSESGLKWPDALCFELVATRLEVTECVKWLDSYEPLKRKTFEELGAVPQRQLPSWRKNPS